MVVSEPGIDDLAGGTVGEGVAAGAANAVALEEVSSGLIVEVDAANAPVGEAAKFTHVAKTVLVVVTPDQQFRELGIARVNQVVVVAIELFENNETIGGGVAKEFVDVVDASVAIFVDSKKPIIGFDPACLLSETISIEIEEG